MTRRRAMIPSMPFKAAISAVLLALALGFGMLAPVAAPHAGEAASAWDRNEHAAVRLVSARNSVGDTGSVRIGLEFEMAPGWHIYWRSPGDAGYPPRVDWSNSDNLAGVEVQWPIPERYTIFGLTTFVYGGEVILPMDVRVVDPSRPLALRGKVSYLVCEKICIPYEAELALMVSSGTGASGPFAARIESFAARVPPRVADLAEGPLAVTGAALVQARDGLALEVLARADAPFDRPELLVEGPAMLRFGVPVTERGRDAREALIRVPVTLAGQRGSVPDAPRLILTLADGTRAVEQVVTAEGRVQGVAGGGRWTMLAIALLGGLILNLMPCVLPVLSLKVLSVVGQGGAARGVVRRGFLATSAGILVSFWLLAAGAVALKGAGVAVGWGMQFQSPAFLGFLAVVVTLFAANLFGLFRIPLPGFAGRMAAHAPEDRGSLSGAFATGAFATLLATPCSAPFLGTALGFALTRAWDDIFAVFTALGLGLALPYLAVAAFPGLATRLPRPGPWMGRLRIVLALALLATALWLLSVLWTVAGTPGALAAGLALAALLGVLALRPRVAGPARAGGFALALAVSAGAVMVPALLARDGDPGRAARPDAAIAWQPFDRVALRNHVAGGKTVFVDVTADWCITCRANKVLVIERGRVAAALAGDGVVAMQADWTRPDSDISDYLRSFGRYGIPFNVVYGPGAPGGIVLPELLDSGTVMEALAAAGNEPARAQ